MQRLGLDCGEALERGDQRHGRGSRTIGPGNARPRLHHVATGASGSAGNSALPGSPCSPDDPIRSCQASRVLQGPRLL
jgi:hypothetical protein